MNRKNQPLSLIASSILLLVLVVAAFWQTSLDFGDFRPDGPAQTVILWGISTLVVLGVLGLGFMVVRNLLKLYLENRRNRLGSKIKTKLVAGALALSVLPAVCMVYFSFVVLNRTLDKWFSRPTKEVLEHSKALTDDVMKQKTATAARWVASMPEVARALETGTVDQAARTRIREFTDGQTATYVALIPPQKGEPIFEFARDDLFQGPVEWRLREPESNETGVESEVSGEFVYAAAPVRRSDEMLGRVVVAWKIPGDLVARRAAMQDQYSEYASLEGERRDIRYFYSGMLALIATFIVFVATWLALLFSRQISVPIEALVEATGEVSSGHLDYRIQTPAMDELAALVHSFNEMTQQLEAKTHELQQSNQSLAHANVELDARRRFIDAILENIAPGVISTSPEGDILKVNSSLRKIFSNADGVPPQHLRDLFSGEDFDDLLHMMSRARRTGLATRDFEITRDGQIIHLTVTVSALEREEQPRPSDPPGFVIVLEDTTELLRAQKSAAWNEVARRVAHEIKNPLTPIALSAERMSRLLRRFSAVEETPERQKLRERFEKCTGIIVQEVETLRTLVDEFSQFARFPTAQPERADLNAVVDSALNVFQGRLNGVVLRKNLATDLPPVSVDPRQFKRALVNLIDNAAEAVRDCWLKEVHISTAPGPLPETVELVVADSGHGITPEDKQKLFLPYFSTRKRGTGLGLAIVSRILSEHQATIRVEDNRPSGSRFIIEIPTAESMAKVPAGVQV